MDRPRLRATFSFGLVTAAALAVGGLGCGQGSDEPVGVAHRAQTNASGHFVATAETTAPGTRLNSTTYSQTQALDGAGEQLGEVKSSNVQRLTQTWTVPLTPAPSPWPASFTIKLVAQKLEGSGDDFSFSWATAAGGPFTDLGCTLTTSDTAYKTCRTVVSVAAGTANAYVRVTDSITSSDSTSNTINVDYVAVTPFDCASCTPQVCQATSVCNATETGCTVTPITACSLTADGCCPSGCTPANDADCYGGIKLTAGAAPETSTGTLSITASTNRLVHGVLYLRSSAQGLANAVYCEASSLCASGSCVSGVCCDSACAGGCGSCTLAGSVGTCTPVAAGPTCRPAAGPCDVAETCNGSTTTCPAEALAALGTPCRAVAGECDLAEVCTGSSAACPGDSLRPGGVECRAAAGPCDVADYCSGTSASCVAQFQPDGTDCGAGMLCQNGICGCTNGATQACSNTCGTGIQKCIDGAWTPCLLN